MALLSINSNKIDNKEIIHLPKPTDIKIDKLSNSRSLIVSINRFAVFGDNILPSFTIPASTSNITASNLYKGFSSNRLSNTFYYNHESILPKGSILHIRTKLTIRYSEYVKFYYVLIKFNDKSIVKKINVINNDIQDILVEDNFLVFGIQYEVTSTQYISSTDKIEFNYSQYDVFKPLTCHLAEYVEKGSGNAINSVNEPIKAYANGFHSRERSGSHYTFYGSSEVITSSDNSFAPYIKNRGELGDDGHYHITLGSNDIDIGTSPLREGDTFCTDGVRKNKRACVNAWELSWGRTLNNGVYFYNAICNGVKHISWGSKADILCIIYTLGTMNGADSLLSNDKIIATTSANNIAIRDDDFTDVESFKSYLQTNNVVIEYELSTPTTSVGQAYQLDSGLIENDNTIVESPRYSLNYGTLNRIAITSIKGLSAKTFDIEILANGTLDGNVLTNEYALKVISNTDDYVFCKEQNEAIFDFDTDKLDSFTDDFKNEYFSNIVCKCIYKLASPSVLSLVMPSTPTALTCSINTYSSVELDIYYARQL